MTHSQISIQAQTALLRHASGIDTLVKNSLRCATAGITALAHSTTEARIPYEKLRGAATPVATLNAQSGPLAQPVAGYMTTRQPINLQCLEKSEQWLPSEPTYFIARLRLETLKDRNTIPTFATNIIERGSLMPSKTTHPSVKLKTKAEAYVQSLGVDLIPLDIGQPSKKVNVNPFAIFLSKVVFILSSRPRLLKLNNLADLSTKTKKLFRLGNLKCILLVNSDSHFMALLTPRNGNRNRNTKNRTDGLYPPSSIRWQHPIPNPVRHSTSEQPQTCAADHQTPNSPKTTYNHLFRNFQLHCSSQLRFLLTCTSFLSLVKPAQGWDS